MTPLAMLAIAHTVLGLVVIALIVALYWRDARTEQRLEDAELQCRNMRRYRDIQIHEIGALCDHLGVEIIETPLAYRARKITGKRAT